jgi:hypothetical protein
MNLGRTVFSQFIAFLPDREFRRCVARHNGDVRLRSFSCWDQFLCLAFAQFTYRESLRDIEACLRSCPDKLYHMGIRGKVSRSTLADANESHNWRIFADFAQTLIVRARALYAQDPFGVEIEHTAYALDSTTIDLCLALFPWARFRTRKAAVKMQTLIDLRGNIPAFVRITDGTAHDVNILDQLPLEPGAFYVMDRGYVDFQRLLVGFIRVGPTNRRAEALQIEELKRCNRMDSFDEQAIPELKSEVIDFRAASEFFAPYRRLTPKACSTRRVTTEHQERDRTGAQSTFFHPRSRVQFPGAR